MDLSHTAEDYLEQIYMLRIRLGRVKTTDIAKAFDIKTPSVISALKTLKGKGYVEYERYGEVTLSEKGLERALEIYERHKTLYRFMHFFLQLPDEVASRDACGMEHFMSAYTQEALRTWASFVQYRREQGDDLRKAFREYRENHRTEQSAEEKPGNRADIPLSEARDGVPVVIVRLGKGREVKRRLLDMGVIPGEHVTIRNRGPMGFPLEVLIQGYVLTLRKDEADSVIVQEVNE